MKKILFIVNCMIFILSNSYSGTMTICQGRFETGQPVYVKIDWNNKAVYINRLHTFIQSAVAYGIITDTYKNQLGISTFSIIGHFQNTGTFITQQQEQYGQIIFTNFARLHCSKEFFKPFSDRMLSN